LSTNLGAKLKQSFNKYASVIILLALIGVCSLLSPAFLTGQNIINITRQISIVTILAFGETLLIIGGELDLSVGSVVGMTGVFAIIFYLAFHSLFLSLLLGLLLGGIVGVVNGFIVTRFHVPSFIVTLAMQMVASGIIFLYTGGQNVYNIGSFTLFGQGNLARVPIPTLFMIAIWLLSWLILRKAKLGRYLYAIGGNVNAARASGIEVNRVKMAAFVISGLLAGLSGVILMSRINAGMPGAGVGFELDALMAAIIGGTSFTGGIGTASGTLIGSFIIGILNNILILLGVQSYVQRILKGALIIIAVAFDIQSKMNRRIVRILD
jgi:inositol transport system permease protein